MNKLLLFVAFLISYGSLYPFSFDLSVINQDRLQSFVGSWAGLTKPGDVFSNIALFIPFGIVGMHVFNAPHNPARIGKLLFWAFALGLTLQVLQLIIPQRIPAAYDVVWNLAGAGIGMMFSMVFVSYVSGNVNRGVWRSIPVVLIGCWLAYRLMPFIPSIDLQLLKTSLKPLLLRPSFSMVEALRDMTGWIIVALLWPKNFISRVDRYHILLLIPVVLFLEIFIVDNVVTLSNVVGAILAIAVWWWGLGRLRNKEIIILLLLLIMLMMQGFSPFSIRHELADFHWLPFSGFLSGSMLVNTHALFGKLFFYGSALWILYRNGKGMVPAAMLMAFWLLLIELGQLFVSSHTPEITDPILVILISIGMYRYHIKYKSLGNMVPDEKNISNYQVESGGHSDTVLVKKIPADVNRGSLRTLIFLILAGVLLPTIAISIFLNLPGVPYNVKELFQGGIFYIAIFSLAVIWVGFSGAYTGFRSSASDYSYLTLPKFVFVTGLISYFLFSMSVTAESMMDVTGSSNMRWQILEKRIWGDMAAVVLSYADWPAGISFVERLVRFLALYSPLIFILAIVSAFSDDLIHKPRTIAIKKLLFYILFSLPWLLLCKIIAFDYSSTDNLNELIERSGEFGLGGGGYLYLLLVVMAVMSTLIARAVGSVLKWKLATVIGIVISVPLGWWLLNHGLVSNFTKYNTTYSGVDFLLGPDRKHKLPQNVLFLRWTVLYAGTIVILAYGHYMALSFMRLFQSGKTQ